VFALGWFRLFVSLFAQELTFVRDGMSTSGCQYFRPLKFRKFYLMMNSLVTTTASIPVSASTTVEDVLNFTKTKIQTFLRLNRVKYKWKQTDTCTAGCWYHTITVRPVSFFWSACFYRCSTCIVYGQCSQHIRNEIWVDREIWHFS